MKTTAELNKSIAFIAKAGAKLDQMIQNTGVDVLEHFEQHKDTGVVNRLFLALPQGARKTAMASWLLAYGALVVNTDATSRKEQPFRYDGSKATNSEAASTDMWYSHKPEKAIDEVFDLQKAVMAILRKAGAAQTLTHGDGDTLKGLAKLVGIPESDVPTKPAKAPVDPLTV